MRTAWGVGALILGACAAVVVGSRHAAPGRRDSSPASSAPFFADGDRELDGNCDFGMLSELSNTGLLDSVIARGRSAEATGDRYFEICTAGVIYYTTGKTLEIDRGTLWPLHGKGICWQTSLDEAKRIALESGKLVFCYRLVGDLEREC